MNDDFETCLEIGREGEDLIITKVLGPRFAEVHRVGGRRLTLEAERSIGDILARRSDRDGWLTVEVKTELEHTGNLFLETWSNRGVRKGWMETSHADVMVFLFKDRMRAYVYDFRRLREWANGPSRWFSRRLDDFPEREQRKYRQRNVTVGRLVQIKTARGGTPDLPPCAMFEDGRRLNFQQPRLFDDSKPVV